MKIEFFALIAILLMVLGCYAGLAYEARMDTDCRMYGMAIGQSVDEIIEICR